MADNLNLPPSISGDGRTFVSALKKILSNVVNVITDTIEPIVNPLINTNTPTAPTNFTVEFSKDGALWRWDYSDNINIDFFELRTDANPGNEVNLVDRVRTTQSTGVPSLRSGIMYLYARWLNGMYSVPVTIQYNKPVPVYPTNIVIEKVFQGFTISCDPIPDYCIGATFRINGDDFFSPNNSFTYNATMGDFIVKVAYKDIFGNGVFSSENTTSIIEVVPPGLVHISETTVFDDGVIVARMIGDQQVVGTKIKDGEITTDKIGANAITAIKILANTITGDKLIADSITTRELAVDAVEAGNIKAGAITTDKLAALSITGDKIYGATITGDKIQAGAVTADKVNADVLNLTVNNKVMDAGAVRLDSTGMKVTEASGAYTKFDADGISWYKDNIPHGAIRRMVQGTVSNGKYVRLNWDKTPFVQLSPKAIQTTVSGFNSSNLQVICEPYDITPAGFRVKVVTSLLDAQGSTSYGTTKVTYLNGESQTITTLSNINSFSVNLRGICGWESTTGGEDPRPIYYYGWIYYTLQYRLVGTTTWNTRTGSLYGLGPVTKTEVFPSLSVGQYEIKLTHNQSVHHSGNGDFTDTDPTPLYLSSISYTGGGVVSSTGQVSFIAIESDQNNYYTIED